LLLTAFAGREVETLEVCSRGRPTCWKLIECQFVCCLAPNSQLDATHFACLSVGDGPLETSSALTYCLLQAQYWTCIIGRAAAADRYFPRVFAQLTYRGGQLAPPAGFLNRQIFGQPAGLSLSVCHVPAICVCSRPCGGIKNLIKIEHDWAGQLGLICWKRGWQSITWKLIWPCKKPWKYYQLNSAGIRLPKGIPL